MVSPLQGGNGEEHDAGEEDDGAREVEARVVVSDGVIQSTWRHHIVTMYVGITSVKEQHEKRPFFYHPVAKKMDSLQLLFILKLLKDEETAFTMYINTT
jgi:hypothetical protein